MRCKELIKENHNVFMIDEKGVRLDLENDFDVQKYEKTNKVDVLELVNGFVSNIDSNFSNIISHVEKLVKKYNIDYYMYGEGKQVSEENLAIIYHLKNRNSCVDCILKVFYQEKYLSSPKINYMIEFSGGASGDNFGFSFYKYFNYENFYKVHDLLEEYLSSDSTGDKDQIVINKCIENIQNKLKHYYSE